MWKIVEEFPNYEVSKDGIVRNRKTLRELAVHTNKPGYSFCRLSKNGKVSNVSLHRIVLCTWDKRENMEEMVVNHKDGNKKNNNLENLQWLSKNKNLQEMAMWNHTPIREINFQLVEKYGIEKTIELLKELL